MRLRRWGVVAAGLGLCGAVLRYACFAQEGVPSLGAMLLSRNVVLSEQNAYLVLPPKVVAPGITENVSISSSGNRVLVTQHAEPAVRSLTLPPTGRIERSLIFRNLQTQRSAVLWRTLEGDAVNTVVEQVAWIPQRETALGVLRSVANPVAPEPNELQGKLFLVNGDTMTLRTVSVVSPGERLLVGTATPAAVLYSAKNRSIKHVESDGRIQPPVMIEGTEELPVDPQWYEEGKTLSAFRVATRNGKRGLFHYLIDVNTGKVTESTQRGMPNIAPLPMKLPPLRIAEGTGQLRKETQTVALHPLWITGENTEALTGQALVTADGEKPMLLPNAVLYEAHGTLYTCPILTVDKTTYLAERRKALKRQTMLNAKTVALAMMMYCQDYDGNYPQLDSNVLDGLYPYTKNNDIFNNPETGQLGVSFAYKNPALSSISSPATTILGYLSGPDGRAIMYVDGHVIWEDKP